MWWPWLGCKYSWMEDVAVLCALLSPLLILLYLEMLVKTLFSNGAVVSNSKWFFPLLNLVSLQNPAGTYQAPSLTLSLWDYLPFYHSESHSPWQSFHWISVPSLSMLFQQVICLEEFYPYNFWSVCLSPVVKQGRC